MGIEVKHHQDGVILSQKGYVHDLLTRAHMNSCKAISTPMATNEKLSREQGTTLVGVDLF